MRAPEKKHARQLDELLHADREIAEPRARIDVETEVLELFRRALGHPPPCDDAHSIHGLAAEKDVLGDGQFRSDAELLMHHADARRQGVARRAEMNFLALDAHGP